MKVISNKYRLIRLIGSGAMGEVFLGEVLGSYGFVRRIAIKLLPRDVRKDRLFREAFIREATTLAGISHPNLVKVFDFGDAGERLFLCMEYIRGFSLRDLIRTAQRWGEKIPIEIAIKITGEILEGLQYIHGRGVIHGDLSPKNIMIGVQGECKILDFGLSRFSSQLPSDAPLGGKAGYMAPEILLEKNILPASDVFSLGAVVLEMLGDKHDLQTMQSKGGSDIHKELFALAQLCLDKDPGRRPEADTMLRKVKEFKRRIDSGFDIKDYLQQVYTEEDYTFLYHEGEERIERKKKKLSIPLATGVVLLVLSMLYLLYRYDFHPNLGGKLVDRTGVRKAGEKENIKEKEALEAGDVAHAVQRTDTVNFPSRSAESDASKEERVAPASNAAEKGEVFTVNSYPEKASVSINEEYVGKTPIDVGFSPIFGNRENVFRLTLAGYKEKVLKISGKKIAEGGNVFVVLQKATGFLRINVNPWAYVFIDGKKLGTTPIIDEVLPVGEHAILLSNDKLGVTIRKTVEIKEGETHVFIEDFYD